MRSVVRLTASATSALPRWVLLTICIIYGASGLFGRDPWKNDDAAGFGVMWTTANGSRHDWLLPNLVGKLMTDAGPLAYWLGAIPIRLLSPWVEASNAARVVTGLLFYATCALVWYSAYLLGRQPDVQPFKYAFGGEPAPRDYGRTLADGALLILLACFGLAERGHETTAEITQLACVAMMLYGLIRSIDKPAQGALWWGVALGLFALAANPPLLIAFIIGALALAFVVPAVPLRPLILLGLPALALLASTWPIAAWLMFPNDASGFLREWGIGNFDAYRGPFSGTLFYVARNLPLFTWPAWPLAIWSWYSWQGLRCKPHVAIPLAIIGPLFTLIVLQSGQTNRHFILLLPALSILAAFGLPTLKRGAINAFDWFAVLSFTILGSFVWLMWLASVTGFPASLARNFARLVPGFQQAFSIVSLICALIVTGFWFALVRWRLARHPKVLWRSVVLSSAGTTLMWVLLMTLWLPFVNYSRTYRDVASQIAAHLPTQYNCIQPVRLGNAQIASFAYFGHMHFTSGNENCDVILRQDTHDFSEPTTLSPFVWKLIWEGRRPADRDERFRLYVRLIRTALPAHRRHLAQPRQ